MSASRDAGSPRNPAAVLVFLTVAALGLGGAAGWSARTLLAPDHGVTQQERTATYEVAAGTVHRSFTLNAAASWAGGGTVKSGRSGIITSLARRTHEMLKPGDVLLTIELEPVIVGVGVTPMFRDLTMGTRGPDVRQVQELLRTLRVRSDPADGIYGGETRRELNQLARRLGLPLDALARSGSILFVPSLPARMVTTAGLAVGDNIASGQAIARILPTAPTFSINLPPGQAELAAVGQNVGLTLGSRTWSAQISALAPPGRLSRVSWKLRWRSPA